MKIIDMHCDTISLLLQKEREGETISLRKNAGHLDLQRMRQSGYLLQNFALYVNKKHCDDPWEEVCALHEMYRKEMAANKDIIAPVLQYGDIACNEAAGKMSAMLTVEEGAVCNGELARLQKLYDMGVRMLTLTWNFPNELGYPHCMEKIDNRPQFSDRNTGKMSMMKGGLTEIGREFVDKMQQIGMIVDVSHLSDAGFYDVLECTNKPFVASHSNARSVCGHSRNLTDDMLRKLSERGGCTGLNFYVDFLESIAIKECQEMAGASAFYETVEIKKIDRVQIGGLDAMVRHAAHIVDVGGIDVLGLGSDFDGIDTNEALPGAQSMELLWNALKKAGFTESQLDKVFYQNVLRVYEDCLK